MDGVARFRTVEDLLRHDTDLGRAFESALKELETRQSECELSLVSQSIEERRQHFPPIQTPRRAASS